MEHRERERIEKEMIAAVLRSFPDCQAIYLFGSFAGGEAREGSDVDIALLLPVKKQDPGTPLSRSELRLELEELCGRDVDLVDLRSVSVVFKKEIIFSGVRIYTGNQEETDIFEMLTMSYYQKLNEERKEILDEFFRTKRAYAV